MSDREASNSTERLWVFAIDKSNTGVSGATISIAIRRDADGHYWNGTGFAALYATQSMSQADAVNLPGLYYYDFNTNGLAAATYAFRAATGSASIVNAPWAGELKIGGWVDNNLGAVVESEGSYTAKQVLSIALAALAGRTADLGLTFKTPNNNATRIAATVNSSDERTAITLTPSA